MTRADDFIGAFREWLEPHHDRMWSDQVWPRAFWFDAFLSHRRSDWSRELADQLGSVGVRAYHDHDVEVRDARVEFELDQALRQSRFVIVCLTPQYRDSLYGHLEYLPALKHGADTGVPRVIVARRDHDVPVPADLTGAAVFDVRDDAGVQALATFIIAQNRVGFPQHAPAANSLELADLFPKDGAARIEELNRVVLGSGSHQKEFALREVGWWAQAVLSGSIDDLMHREQALGLAWVQIVERGIVTPEWHDYLWRCAFVMMYSPHGDSAEVGTGVFLWAARSNVIPNERQLLTQRMWAETMLNGRARLCALLLNRLDELTEPDPTAIERAVLTYPALFADSRKHLAALASNTARTKVGMPGLDENQLPPDEAIHLIHERVKRLKQSWIGNPKSVGLFETENVVRELSARVRPGATEPGALVGVYESLLESKGDALPLAMRLQLPELVQLVYLPLGRLNAADPNRVRPLLTALNRALISGGFRRTGAVLAEQIASGGPFDTRDLDLALGKDWREFERRRG